MEKKSATFFGLTFKDIKYIFDCLNLHHKTMINNIIKPIRQTNNNNLTQSRSVNTAES